MLSRRMSFSTEAGASSSRHVVALTELASMSIAVSLAAPRRSAASEWTPEPQPISSMRAPAKASRGNSLSRPFSASVFACSSTCERQPSQFSPKEKWVSANFRSGVVIEIPGSARGRR
jgi:hypothetical protein